MLRSITQTSFAALLLAAPTTFVAAQNFVSPSANTVEYTFGDPVMDGPKSTSAYSLSGSYVSVPALGLNSPDLYLAGWNNPKQGGMSEVTVLLTQYGDPANVLWKTSLPYSDVMDMEVGCVYNYFSHSTNILVAYYRPGQGHILDIYDFNGTATNPVQHIDQVLLSNSANYGRIRMDFHAVYDCVIAWINPGVGIQTKVYTNNTWSNIKTLNNTANKAMFDVAVNRVIEPVNNSSIAYPVHFVYPNGFTIVESSVDMTQLASATAPTIISPTLNDNNYVASSGAGARLVLDCADFSYNSSSWAYTYTDGQQVSVRHKNATMGASGQTVVVTAGTLANSNPLDPTFSGVYKLYNPTLNYSMGYLGTVPPEKIMVAWYATDGASFNGYIAAEMDQNGTTLTSDPDYLLLPNGQTPSMPGGFTPGITLSKIGPKSMPPFLYTTYYDVDPNTGHYQLHHAFHNWGDTRFRPGQPDNTGVAAVRDEQIKVNTYPNPFASQLSISVSMPQNGDLDLVLTDISGRGVWQRTARLDKGIHMLEANDLGQLAPGTYFLTTSLNKQKIGTSKVTKQ